MKTRTNYSAEFKMEVIRAVISRETTIQKIAKEKGLSATLISLWKRQAEEAAMERFQPQPRGRKKAPITPEEVAAGTQSIRREKRIAKTKAAHLEIALRAANEKLAALEKIVATMAGQYGCRLVRERTRRKRK